jgi:tetratricopeptide (TPR) repeat protein
MSSKLHLSYASGYLQLGMLREAAAELARIDRDLAGLPEVLRLKVDFFTIREDWHTVRRYTSQLVKLEPADVQAWVTLGYSTRRSVSIRAARRILLRAAALHPEEPVLKFNLACYAAQLGKLPEASLFLTTALALDPRYQELALADPDLAPLREEFQRGLC